MKFDGGQHRDGRTLVLLSGGIDSFCCAHFLKRVGHQVSAMFIDYGHAAASVEAGAAERLAGFLSIPFTAVRICSTFKPGAGEIVGRNLMLVSTALFAATQSVSVLAIGIHAGTDYYDCSGTFFRRLWSQSALKGAPSFWRLS